MNEFEDPFDLYPHSEPSGRHDEEGREIRLIGHPILASNPRLNNRPVPDEYQGHPLVAGRYFYTLPLDVIDNVVDEIGEDRFETDLLTMERRLSAVSGDHSSNVGLWRNAWISYRQLRISPVPPVSEEWDGRKRQEAAALNHALRIYEERDKGPVERFARGYCGWLLTNRQFLDEHDELLARHAETVRRWGTHRAATFLPADYRANLLPGTDPNMDPLWPAFVEDCGEYLIRWRLSSLAGPYLPIPAQALMAGVFSVSVVQRWMGAGGVFYLPDTMPIPSRDQLRGMLDHALHKGEKPDHLTEWLEIVRAGNTARNRMDPFIRYFELQHYWRTLSERHTSAIYRKTTRLKDAFGRIFDVGSQQIHKDLVDIRRRLGGDWLDRPWPLDSADRPAPSTVKKPR